MLRLVYACILLISSASGCGGSQNPETAVARPFSPSLDADVARLFTHPFPEGSLPYGFKFSPDGGTLAYFRLSGQGESIVPQLWLLDLSERTQQQMLWDATSPPVGTFQWFPDSRKLLINAEGNLFVAPIQGGLPSQLTSRGATAEQLSPNGNQIAFIREHDLWIIDVESGNEQQLTTDGSDVVLNGEVDWVYEEELGLSRGFWWSPDSRRLAFMQFDESPVTSYPVVHPGHPAPHVARQRYPQAGEPNPHVRLGVIELSDDEVPSPLWLDLETPNGEEIYLARVGWDPAGSRVYIITLDRLQRVLRLSLLDPLGTTQMVTILEERDQQWLNLLDEPLFLAQDGQFLWRSEQDGHAHLYLHDSSGEMLRQLTRGPWEVSEVQGVDETNGVVYFTANRESSASYQLYSTSLSGEEEPRQVSSEGGCHRVILAPDRRHYIDVHSSLNRPPRAELFAVNGSMLSVVAEEDLRQLPDLTDIQVELLDIPGPQDISYKARIFRPAQMEEGQRFPVLIWVYNGPGAQIVRDEWRTKYVPWMRLLASRGVIVFSMDGRGTHGRGRDWEKPIYARLTEVELEDQLLGVEYLRSLPYVDGERIGIFGWSYGGTMVLSALLRHPGTFRVGVAVAPVSDWRFYDTIYTERYMMRPQDNPEGYQRTALWPHASRLRDPLLLIHGLSDDNVHFRNSSRMIEALVDEGRNFQVMTYPGQSHGISAPAARRHVFSSITSFLLEHLHR